MSRGQLVTEVRDSGPQLTALASRLIDNFVRFATMG